MTGFDSLLTEKHKDLLNEKVDAPTNQATMAGQMANLYGAVFKYIATTCKEGLKKLKLVLIFKLY